MNVQETDKMGERGYLGPIGDDFPSIFPIAFGLIFFFGSITITYNNYNQKRDLGQSMRANLLLSKGARRETMVNEEYWGDACDFFKSMKANYGVDGYMMIISEKAEEDDSGEGLVYEFDGGDPAFCTDISPEAGQDPESPDHNAITSSKEGEQITTMEYPVVVEREVGEDKVAEVYGLRVVTWS